MAIHPGSVPGRPIPLLEQGSRGTGEQGKGYRWGLPHLATVPAHPDSTVQLSPDPCSAATAAAACACTACFARKYCWKNVTTVAAETCRRSSGTIRSRVYGSSATAATTKMLHGGDAAGPRQPGGNSHGGGRGKGGSDFNKQRPTRNKRGRPFFDILIRDYRNFSLTSANSRLIPSSYSSRLCVLTPLCG